MTFILPFLSILIGYIFGATVLDNRKWIAHLLSFSGAFLLSVTLFELLPDVFSSGEKRFGILIMAGILLQLILEYFSKGAEHGHVHLHENAGHFPLLLFLSLSVHAFIEGFPVVDNPHILWGVVLHKIPIALILTIYFRKAKVKPLYTFLFLLLFALMTPIGSLMASNIVLFQQHFMAINAVAIGIFLHVSTTILFESSKDHRFNLTKLLTILTGVIIAYLV